MDKNSLSNLIRQYRSDSENDEDGDNKNILDGQKRSPNRKTIKEQKPEFPTTYWTQCIDPKSGHPYYWNTATKDVTWEIPSEYEEYVNFMKSFVPQSPENCWTVGCSEDSDTKYYVNQYTRVVSWEKPPGFIEKERKKKKSVSKSTEKQPDRKNKSKTKKPDYSDDEKIELITSYNMPSGTSSEDEAKQTKEKINTLSIIKEKNKLNLVAAYATDSDNESEDGEERVERLPIKMNSEVKNAKLNSLQNELKSKEQCENTELSELVSEDSISQNIPSPLIQANSFASIITGCKPEEELDSELSKLKEEFEKEDNEIRPESKSSTLNQVNEECFDGKTFQRKRRIEFITNPIVTQTTQVEERAGLGFHGVTSMVDKSAKKNMYINFKKSHVEFSQSSNIDTILETDNVELERKLNVNGEDIISTTEFKNMCDIISGKIKFLLVGAPTLSPVQVMDIQLETLLHAYRMDSLQKDYLFKWLKQTSDELLTLEKCAAPEGWECIWDRTCSQYCYKNISSGDIEWNFPSEVERIAQEEIVLRPDIVETQRGEDEMDISTTPPPNENEQIQFENRIGIVNEWNADSGLSSPMRSTDLAKQPSDINTELASFYSDIATIDVQISSVPDTSGTASAITESDVNAQDDERKLKKPYAGNGLVEVLSKKRKKNKVPGLGSKMKEVSGMVAAWKKAQKELEK